MNVERYRFPEAERLRVGRYPVLDTILYRWARRIEETLFEQFQLELYAGASTVEEMRFATFYASLRGPRPIYFVGLEPLEGSGLLVLDNRFANLCLHTGGEPPPGAGPDALTLAPHNQGRLQRVVQRLMGDFDAAWADVYPVRARLRRITTYLFRARILSSYERCLVAHVHLSGHRLSARLSWCLPRILLDPVLDRLETGRVIPSVIVERRPPRLGERVRPEGLHYRLAVNLGHLEPAPRQTALQVGQTVPLGRPVGEEAVVTLNGTPVLTGQVGEARGHYAVKLTGPYRESRRAVPLGAESFHPIRWPDAPA